MDKILKTRFVGFSFALALMFISRVSGSVAFWCTVAPYPYLGSQTWCKMVVDGNLL